MVFFRSAQFSSKTTLHDILARALSSDVRHPTPVSLLKKWSSIMLLRCVCLLGLISNVVVGTGRGLLATREKTTREDTTHHSPSTPPTATKRARSPSSPTSPSKRTRQRSGGTPNQRVLSTTLSLGLNGQMSNVPAKVKTLNQLWKYAAGLFVARETESVVLSGGTTARTTAGRRLVNAQFAQLLSSHPEVLTIVASNQSELSHGGVDSPTLGAPAGGQHYTVLVDGTWWRILTVGTGLVEEKSGSLREKNGFRAKAAGLLAKAAGLEAEQSDRATQGSQGLQIVRRDGKYVYHGQRRPTRWGGAEPYGFGALYRVAGGADHFRRGDEVVLVEAGFFVRDSLTGYGYRERYGASLGGVQRLAGYFRNRRRELGPNSEPWYEGQLQEGCSWSRSPEGLHELYCGEFRTNYPGGEKSVTVRHGQGTLHNNGMVVEGIFKDDRFVQGRRYEGGEPPDGQEEVEVEPNP